jgi:pilus assembly protein CpaC
MLPIPFHRRNFWKMPSFGVGLALSALVLWGWYAASQSSAEPAPCPTISGFKPCLTPTPQKPPRPPTGKEAVSSFVDSLSTNDSAFEVLLGQGRILTLKEDLEAGNAARGQPEPLIAVGDPTVVDLVVINARQIRVIGSKMGVTDLSITTSNHHTYSFEVRVVADLDVLRGQLRCLFPDASLKLAQIRDHIVVEGEARDSVQVGRIIETIGAYLFSVRNSQVKAVAGTGGRMPGGPEGEEPGAVPGTRPDGTRGPATTLPETTGAIASQARVTAGTVINLIRVPGSKQVLLKVRVAELNRTAMRQIGGDILGIDPNTGAIIGTQIGGTGVFSQATATPRTVATLAGSGTGVSNSLVSAGAQLTGTATNTLSPQNTLFGIFQEGDFAIFLSALRKNALLKVLAEPNLVAMDGHQASFLAGGEFPVPVPQTGGGGISPTITVQFQPFGVRLGFVPYILDDDVIRLSVDPEVSQIDFAFATTLVPGGSPVPGLDIRRAHTVVELHQGQTLAIAGLMQLTLDGTTSKIPFLGDLPFIGPFFQNTTNDRIEKELIVLVTPYLVEPMNQDQVPPTPGDEVKEPNDLEFYLLHRIQGRTGRDWRSTTEYDDPLHIIRCLLKMEKEHVQGPHGLCD